MQIFVNTSPDDPRIQSLRLALAAAGHTLTERPPKAVELTIPMDTPLEVQRDLADTIIALNGRVALPPVMLRTPREYLLALTGVR